MERFYARFGYVAMVVIPVGFVLSMIHDFRHPELWGDWTHNPHVYLPLAAIMFVPVLLYAAFVVRQIWRTHKQIKQRAEYLEYLRKQNPSRGER